MHVYLYISCMYIPVTIPCYTVHGCTLTHIHIAGTHILLVHTVYDNIASQSTNNNNLSANLTHIDLTQEAKIKGNAKAI